MNADLPNVDLSRTDVTDAVTQRRRIGRTALEVTALSLGSAPFGGLYQALSEEVAHACVDAAWDAGIRYFDTAPHYGRTKAEHVIGAALRRRPRQDYVLSTKVGRRFVAATTPYDGSDGWDDPLPFDPVYDYTYDGILRSFEDSQQRLGIPDIDIVLVHDIGRYTHGEQHLLYWRQLRDHGGFRALDELRRTCGVKAVGLGVNEGEAIIDAMAEFDIDCALLAGRYTLLEQAVLSDLLPQCEQRGVSILIGGVFNSGILARGRDEGKNVIGAVGAVGAIGAIGANDAVALIDVADRGERSDPALHVASRSKFNYGDAPPAIVERVEQLERLCRSHGVALSSAALQFPYAHPAVASVLMGVRSPLELQRNVASFCERLPSRLWETMREQNLLSNRAPVPR